MGGVILHPKCCCWRCSVLIHPNLSAALRRESRRKETQPSSATLERMGLWYLDAHSLSLGGSIISTPASSSSCPTASTTHTCNHRPTLSLVPVREGARQLKDTSSEEEDHAPHGSAALPHSIQLRVLHLPTEVPSKAHQTSL